jgi:hypothetical protein
MTLRSCDPTASFATWSIPTFTPIILNGA